jgi:hypothetical protein
MKTQSLVAGFLFSLVLVAIPLGCTKTVTTTAPAPTITITSAPITIPVVTYTSGIPNETGADEPELYIVIGGGYADPISYININQEFVWTNQDHQAHTVTSASITYGDPNYFDFTLQPGESVEYTITQPGVYIYSDTLNPSNVAEIIAK